MKVPFIGVTIGLGAVLTGMVAIIATGMLLDEAGKGTFGDLAKKAAVKTTNGYGV